MQNLTQQEKLFEVVQLAKAIFINKCGTLDFTTLADIHVKAHVIESFSLSEDFIDGQERYVEMHNC